MNFHEIQFKNSLNQHLKEKSTSIAVLVANTDDNPNNLKREYFVAMKRLIDAHNSENEAFKNAYAAVTRINRELDVSEFSRHFENHHNLFELFSDYVELVEKSIVLNDALKKLFYEFNNLKNDNQHTESGARNVEGIKIKVPN